MTFWQDITAEATIRIVGATTTEMEALGDVATTTVTSSRVEATTITVRDLTTRVALEAVVDIASPR